MKKKIWGSLFVLMIALVMVFSNVPLSDNTPKTADHTPLVLMIIVCAGACMVLILVLIEKIFRNHMLQTKKDKLFIHYDEKEVDEDEKKNY